MQQKNSPDLWFNHLPSYSEEIHKYDRGHALIYAAPELTGATRLSASACARIGAGLVTVLCNKESANIYRSTLPAHVMVRDNLEWWDDKVTAVAYGSGGLSAEIKIRGTIKTVLDADALSHLPERLSENVVLTPHEGEFEKAFPHIAGTRLERAEQAAKLSGAIVVLKGAQTLIAHPDGRIVINEHASSNLATAGTGDVLAGMITGLMAQNMPSFEAACSAVWIHGACGISFGKGLVASDIPDMIPDILKDL